MIAKGNKIIQLDQDEMLDLQNLMYQLDWFASLVKLDTENSVISTLIDAACKSSGIELKETVQTIHRISMSSGVIEKVLKQIN
ncbi:hypothetical protein [Sphingobacterium hotanense]|uniref:Uncharacterized protein n=1 Tax=Sphingobacterium hotanense TaxID=649196 RepID=A0ABT7NQ96_9SPHI|nr:hypothetical protein [Sphingobacterium hotanense]MDM1049365.1 hypothetical protein [Sphingobacterium hotanense]